ncbi:prephenate dehydratase [Paenibacillus senegalensis]|uniref:prephenate dehydratase n=1 Tax=Paenibacillus senegalensis TaxID=1465766 RepID=UPI000287B89D|nr:prephenate dehydratase [Paenibacillus senegalensis]
MARVAFLGPAGTVSQESAVYFFNGQTHDFIPYPFIADVFKATAAGETDYSVVPIENTIEGSVKIHVDQLVQYSELPIQAEWIYPSMQNLIGYRSEESGSPLSHVKTILSIDVAVAQCLAYLGEHLPGVKFEYVSSTAEGVRRVKEEQNPTLAAIGTRLAAQLYDLDILASNITDHQNNFTRFILVGPRPPQRSRKPEHYKTTLLVTLPEDFPGALHQVLAAFAWRKINLTKIESRPTKLKLGSYYFYIDAAESIDSVLLPAALSEIEALGCQVKVLGSYPSYTFEKTNLEV